MEYEYELYHHGVKGMKWGVRRYQNSDGSLTSAGKKRYDRDQRENAGKKKGDKVGAADPNRWVREDLERSRSVANEGANLSNKLRDANRNSMRNQKRSRMDLSKMSDNELRQKINRELLERQYNDVFNPAKVSKGREVADRVLDSAGTALSIAGSAAALALAIKQLRG